MALVRCRKEAARGAHFHPRAGAARTASALTSRATAPPVRMCGSKTAGLHNSSWYTVTLYDVGRPTAPVSELSGTVLIKASAAPLHKVTAAFCRWLSLPEGSVRLFLNGKPLLGAASAEQAGIATGAAISARLTPDAPEPEQGLLARRCALLNVVDSEQAPAPPLPTPLTARHADDGLQDDEVAAALRAARPGAERVLLLGECLLNHDRPLLHWLTALLEAGSAGGGAGGGGDGEGGGGEGEGEGAAAGGLSEAEVGTLLQLELACRGCASDLSCLPRCPRTWLWASWPRPRGCVVVSRGHAMKVSR